MATGLVNLSKSESAIVSQALQHNAKTLKATAESAAKMGNFGVARSLLILSAEESIKGAILFLKSVGVDVTSHKELRIALRRHKERHETALIFKFFKVVEPFVLPAQQSKPLFKSKLANQILSITEAILQAVEDVGDDYKWWNDADDYKNDGLYVDYKNQLQLPSSITEEDYLKAVAKVNDLMKRLRVLQLVLRRVSIKQRESIVSGLNEALKMVTP